MPNCGTPIKQPASRSASPASGGHGALHSPPSLVQYLTHCAAAGLYLLGATLRNSDAGPRIIAESWRHARPTFGSLVLHASGCMPMLLARWTPSTSLSFSPQREPTSF